MYQLMQRHYAWLIKMGYANTRPLEALALVCGEIGEAVNECRTKDGTIENYHAFSEELADIVLRVMGIASQYNIDLENVILMKICTNEQKGNKGRTI